MLEQIGEIHTDLRGSFTDCFLLMTGLALSSVLAVLSIGPTGTGRARQAPSLSGQAR
jgi:hypothetical protein